ncbi:GNAT family N-acetyltransferase [Ectobacillus sp. JY-23]|uniref:GNAT family N-acetyltransferase n=1 Tax=Ectobacillus sp. JY-23 TaxID=2933872 RepID=UPI001FF32EDA|nr:GNAT family N-acetyltransferase [Ectobacillus sp. JY-23]UOY92920.1 GNAT family N-acetyltransferase [Ectobacillus sp. JY-23]
MVKIIIKSLENINLQEFTICFNDAFSDYIIPFKVSPHYLAERFTGAGVHYNLSFGVFSEDKQVAFIMHGIEEHNGEKIAFDIGTGVIPSYRGKRLVAQIYNHAIPILKQHNVQKCLLEVIQTNEKAIKAYNNLGFQIKRELSCFKGSIRIDLPPSTTPEHICITTVSPNKFDWSIVHAFWNFEPSWEQSVQAILRNPHLYDVITISEQNTICGYAVIDSKQGRILQFGVLKEKRNQGFGHSLFQWIGKRHSIISINNVDKYDIESIRFLKKIGLNIHIEQYEMEKTL